jgi:hypothetical protein
MSGGGKFIWLQHSSWPGTIRPYSGKGPSAGLCLTGGCAVRYAQEKDESGFFSDVTTVLPPSGFAGNHTGLFRMGGTHQRPFSDPQNP